ncbi:MAG: DUF2911 domain-containing protein [Planctomycetota bacterium]|nr:DUF2911 domain-containing protein [Planctomycetota bacterium]
MIQSLLRASVLSAVVATFALSVPAQTPAKIEFPAASPTGKIEQRVGFTDIEVVYGRPGAKGRKVFGELVPFGEVWRTGANTATSISFSTAVKFGGTDVPAGKYALFTIPAAGEWTVILSKVTEQWGAYQYDKKDDQARVKVKPLALAEAVETFEIGIGDVRDASATLVLSWEKTRVPVKLEFDMKSVVPEIESMMAGAGKKPYLQAAMFYYDNDLDLKKAITWMDAGLAEQPEAFWMTYRKGLILAKMGDKKGAIAAAEASLAMAKKAEGGIKDEYVRLNEALIARLK